MNSRSTGNGRTGIIPPPPTPRAIWQPRKGYGSGLRDSRLRKQRALFIAEMSLRGVPMKEITEALNITERTAYRQLALADRKGWLEQVRHKMQETADKAPQVLDTILDTDAETLHKHHKGYALKSEVARELMKGMGVFSPEQKNTTTVNLNNWHAQHGAAESPAAAAPPSPLDFLDVTPYEHDPAQIGHTGPEPTTPDDRRRDDGPGDPDEPGEGW